MTIFHLIDSFKRGGAETLLYHVVKNLKGHQNYLVILTGEVDFSQKELDGIQIISLKFSSFLSLPKSVLKFRKLLAIYKPDLVHAHLPLSSLVARLATPSRIKLVISIHNTYSESLKKISPRLFFLEKKLHTRRENLVFVSGAIKTDYDRIIGIRGRSFILYNFIGDKFFLSDNQATLIKDRKSSLRLIAVGSLKYQKNFDSLIKAFSLLNRSVYSLDIYGEGTERENLEKIIKQYELVNVQLKGAVPNVETLFKNYDAFILASRYEGFGLAPLEAAATGLPLLLSNIEVFKEVTMGLGIYFPAEDLKEMANRLEFICKNYEVACEKAISFKPLVKQYYSKDSYMQQLISIYQS